MRTPPRRPPPHRARRRLWGLLAALAALGVLALAYAPVWLGPALLPRLGSGWQAERVGGPVWAPQLSGVRVQLPGVQGEAERVGVRVTGVDWRSRTLALSVDLRGGAVNVGLADLVRSLRGGGGGGTGGGAGWKVALGGLKVADTRLKLNGRGLNVPDFDLRLSPGSKAGPSRADTVGEVAWQGRTPDGALSGRLIPEVTPTGHTALTLTFQADARVLRHYWKGVEAGELRGRYHFGAGPITGDVALTGGLVRVPGAHFVEVCDVTGRGEHRGEAISLKLRGQGWDGPATLTGGADLKAEHWNVVLDAAPTLGGLGRALGTTGDGNLKLRLQAGGWSTVRVKGYGRGSGRLAGVPFEEARAEYTFLNRHGQKAAPTNDLAFSARTTLAGTQALTGRWAFGREGGVRWRGDLAGRPLDLSGVLGPENRLAVEGQALGGPVEGRYTLRGAALSATLNPDYGAARGVVELSGRPGDLRARLSGQAGPFPLTGTARLGHSGLSADLSGLRLRLGRDLAGTWQAEGLSGAGVALGGGGNVDLGRGTLAGDLRADLPGLPSLPGRVNLNVRERQGSFAAQGAGTGDLRVGWAGNTLTLSARGLSLSAGPRLTGNLRAELGNAAGGAAGAGAPRLYGEVRAQGEGYDLRGVALGDVARVSGQAGGVSLSARSELRAPYRTRLSAPGSDLSADLKLEGGGVAFALNTPGQLAQGRVAGADWDARGGVNLAALRPLWPGAPADLSGLLRLNLAGRGGTAQLQGRAGGTDLRAELRREAGPSIGARVGTGGLGRIVAQVGAQRDLGAGNGVARANLTGPVYPEVALSGRLSALGQSVQASVTGPYAALRLTASGRSGALSAGGISLPAQDLRLSGRLTPRPELSGRWGRLEVAYAAPTLRVRGVQTVTAFGQTGEVSGSASWGPGSGSGSVGTGSAGTGWAGRVDLRGELEGYVLSAQGPWDALTVRVTDAEGLEALGRASLPAGRYDLRVRGPLNLPGQGGPLRVDGRLQGTGTRPRGTLSVYDAAGGQGEVRLDGLDRLEVKATRLTLAGQPLSGELRTHRGVLEGQLQAGPLQVSAAGGGLRASGELAGHRLSASGRLTLPATLSGLRVSLDGPFVSGEATGDVANLRGELRLKPLTFGSAQAGAAWPAQTFPLRGSLTGGRVEVGGLRYAGGEWSGSLGAAYRLLAAGQSQPGTLRLVGEGRSLLAQPSGPVTGRLTVLPTLGGTLQTSAAPWASLLPAEVRRDLRAGNVQATFTPSGADFALLNATYLGQSLSVTGQAGWSGGTRVSALVQHPYLRLPLSYSDAGLRVSGARITGQALPGDLRGEAGLSLSVPLKGAGLDWARASGRLRSALRGSGTGLADLSGELRLGAGELNGALRAGPLNLTLTRNRLSAQGAWGAYRLSARARVSLSGAALPDLREARLSLSGPALNASASGDLRALRGSLQTKAQRFGADAAGLALPAQRFPVRLLPLQGRAEVGGLRYAGGEWSGSLGAAYRLLAAGQSQPGTLRLVGEGRSLLAQPSGPVTGRLAVLPALGGTLQTSAAPWASFLPAEVRRDLRAGNVQATFTPSGADFALLNATYLGQSLSVTGQAGWSGGTRVSALVQHPYLRLPLSYSDAGLRVSGARLDGRLAGRLAPELRGQVALDLRVPGRAGGLNFGAAQGGARLDLSAGGDAARGRLSLSGGRLSAGLAGQVAGQALSLSGPLYPRAAATLRVGELRADLSGDARQTLTLAVKGPWQGRALDLRAQATGLARGAGRPRVAVTGTVASAPLSLSLAQEAGGGLAAWQLGGGAQVPDLRALGGPAGSLSLSLGGTLAQARAEAVGEAAGVTFRLPLRYAAGRAELRGGELGWPGQGPQTGQTVQTAGGQAAQRGEASRATLSGEVWPNLRLSGVGELREGLPGRYEVALGGTFAKPDLRVRGRLRDGVYGLDAAGTALEARLLGRDWRADLSGPKLSGELRGALNQSGPGGLSRAALRLQTSYSQPGLRLNLSGPLAWAPGPGWSGSLRVTGDVPGGGLDAVADGRGELRLAGTLGTGERAAAFVGRLPAGLPLRPAGELSLTRLDAGAFWGRPGELRATGQATLGGESWAGLRVAFAGALEDRAGDLSGALRASAAPGELRATLSGERVSAQAELSAGAYALALRAQPLSLARALPASWGVTRLDLGGRLSARGRLGGPAQGSESAVGLLSAELSGFSLRGEQKDAGPFTLFGSARYGETRAGELGWQADLRGSLRGGRLEALGSLSEAGKSGSAGEGGLRLRLSGVPLDYPGARGLGLAPSAAGDPARPGLLNADLTLSGPARDPWLSGQAEFTLRRGEEVFGVRLTPSGRAARPNLHARVTASGAASGTLYAEARALDLARLPRVPARVYGTLRRPGGSLRADLTGTWPELSGQAELRLDALPEALTLRGDGRGAYALNAGALGSGDLRLSARPGSALPELSGRLSLTPLPLLPGAEGQARLDAALSGPLNAPQLAARWEVPELRAGGLSLRGLSGDLGGPLSMGVSGLRGAVTQGGRAVGTLASGELVLTSLEAGAAGSRLSLSGRARPEAAALRAAVSGTLAGDLSARYERGSGRLSGTLHGGGLKAALDAWRTPQAGWGGGARVTGGPDGLLSDPLVLSLRGPAQAPALSGVGGLLGARAELRADLGGADLRLSDGPQATANGQVSLRPGPGGEWVLGGAASLSRPELSLSVTPSGPLSRPEALLTLRRGEWRASGTASPRQADLSVSDGLREGRLSWQAGGGPSTIGQPSTGQVRADLAGLDLARLGIRGLSGQLSLRGAVSPGGDGTLDFGVQNVVAPAQIPYLGLALQGDLSGTLTLAGGRPSLQGRAQLPSGALDLEAGQAPDGRWQGRVSGRLEKPGVGGGAPGELRVDLNAGAGRVTGALDLSAFALEVGGQTLRAEGRVALLGQTFQGDLRAAGVSGEADLNASVKAQGGLADVWPALGERLGVAPTGEGYSAQLSLGAVDLAALKLAPDLGGELYGEATLNDGGGTFLIQSPSLKLGPKSLPLRVEGTQVAGNWRLRGFLERSDFTAGLSDAGEVFGEGSLRALPLGALVAAVSGTSPGEGVVTGVARFRFPLADPLAGRVNVVAERVRVTATREENGQAVTETLTGTGLLDYAARELRRINLQLAGEGTGTWDVQGEYTRQKVDVNARFTNTTFTPVLQLVPALAPLGPALRGTLTLSAAGTYDRPRGLLRAENLSGELAGLSLRIPSFAGDLPDSGAFTAGGRLLTGGTLASEGDLTLSGQLTLGVLSQTALRFGGWVAPEALGRLPETVLTLRQAGADWTLEGSSRASGPNGIGSLSLSGRLTPRLDLSLSARNYNLPIRAIYARENELTADLQARDDGDFIRVSGGGDFGRLVLGRVDAVQALPAPAGSPASSGAGGQGVPFNSPLPTEYTTFSQASTPQTSSSQTPGTQASAAPRSTPLLERVLLQDLRLQASGGVRLDENLARAEFSTPGLTVSGTAARPRVQGRLVAQRGTLLLRENEFTIQEGAVNFDGSGLYPTFALSARSLVASPTTRQQVPVALRVSGDFLADENLPPGTLKLETFLSCAEESAACRSPKTDTPYTEGELYALVATGLPDLSTLPENLSVLGASALQTALNVFFLGELERNLARALGVDVFRLTPALQTDGSLNATLTFGSYLTRELFVQYQVDLSGRGLIDATYSTPDGRFTFRVSTSLTGLDLDSLRPNFSASYNFNRRLSVGLGVENRAAAAAVGGLDAVPESTKLQFKVTYRVGVR